ncbi:UNVERIFIED_CONTAM: hypothetical protein Sradi_6925800, partial [Sesamum radiatum]
MGKEKKSKHGKTISEIMEMKKKKENSTKMNQSNNFEDSSNPVSPTRPQVRTMGEIMEMKRNGIALYSHNIVRALPLSIRRITPRAGLRHVLNYTWPLRLRCNTLQAGHKHVLNNSCSSLQVDLGYVPNNNCTPLQVGPGHVRSNIALLSKKEEVVHNFQKDGAREKKLEVTLDSKGRVIGPDVNHYKTAIGCMARIGVKLPLNYVEFNHIPEYLRVMAWEEVEHNTFLPPEAKSVVLADLKDIWRRWKHEIKVKYFLPHIDDLEFLSQSPTERVEQDQWKELVTYWKDEDVQKIARKNAINVSKKQCLHRTGRTSFAILKQEMMMKGTDPSTLDVWLESRSRGKGFEDDDTLDLH